MGDINIVHLCQDEKWTGGAYYLFEKAFPKRNRYIVIKSARKSLRYIKFIDSLVETRIDKLDPIASRVLEDASIVVLHGLNVNHAEIASKFRNKKNILWLTMGAEIYQNPYIYDKELMGIKTKKLKEEIENRFYLREGIKRLYRYFKYRKRLSNDEGYKLIAKVAKSIDYVGVFYKGRFEMLKELEAIDRNATFQQFSYYPLEYIVDSEEDIDILGENILLGNSASYTNNHLEAIDEIANLEIENRKIYTPLSYGNGSYAKEVVNYGRRKLKSNFYPLVDFISLKDYNNLIQSCGIVIMNHYRDQGVGNILSTLYRGSKLFMSEKSAVYQYLMSIGCFVFSIEKDLCIENKEVFDLLNLSQISHNRNILKREISENVLINSLKKGVKEYLVKGLI